MSNNSRDEQIILTCLALGLGVSGCIIGLTLNGRKSKEVEALKQTEALSKVLDYRSKMQCAMTADKVEEIYIICTNTIFNSDKLNEYEKFSLVDSSYFENVLSETVFKTETEIFSDIASKHKKLIGKLGKEIYKQYISEKAKKIEEKYAQPGISHNLPQTFIMRPKRINEKC